jgi:hypothetical protein
MGDGVHFFSGEILACAIQNCYFNVHPLYGNLMEIVCSVFVFCHSYFYFIPPPSYLFLMYLL